MCPRSGADVETSAAHMITTKPPVSDDSLALCATSTTSEDVDVELATNLDLQASLTRCNPKTIPVRFLYDDVGSALYEEITRLEEYYPYSEESQLLQHVSNDVISHLPSPAIFVELGCGDGTKTSLLLQALARRDGPSLVRFIGIDVSGGALAQAKRNLTTLCPDIPPPNLEFIEAEYLDGLQEAHARHPDSTLCILFLGSTIGNFSFPEAATFLHRLRIAAGPRSAILLCTDLWKDPRTLQLAYDDPKGVTRAFILNGMRHALRTLGHLEAADAVMKGGFTYECIVNTTYRQVEMWVQAQEEIKNVLPPGAGVGEGPVHIALGEKILMEISRKFTPEDITALAQQAHLCLHATWATPKYSMQLLVPPMEALTRCWTNTDALFLSHFANFWWSQPIGLRHPFAFYYGHVTSFARTRLERKKKHHHPESTHTHHPHSPLPLDDIFSRGIDPIVLDPSVCHSHPEVPEQWPADEEIKQYVGDARQQVLQWAVDTFDDEGEDDDSDATTTNNNNNKNKMESMHALIMCLEHERMHQETLCYMAAQQRKHEFEQGTTTNGTTTTSTTSTNSFYFDRCSYMDAALPPLAKNTTNNKVVCVPGGKVTMGIDPTTTKHGYVWDNELGTSGCRTVGDLVVSTTPVTVAEYRDFILDGGYDREGWWDKKEDFEHFKSMGHRMPATWSSTTEKGKEMTYYVHMPEGTYHWEQVANCPVYCSLAEASAYCKFRGGRVMTEAEYCHILEYRGQQKVNIPTNENSISTVITIQALTTGGWEWTSSPLEPFEGFTPHPLYPLYSADFFDNSHYVLKGACPYTHPSVQRRSFRNFYQRQYPYVFAKFRVVEDRN